MFKVGDKLRCIEEKEKIYVEKGEVVEVAEVLHHSKKTKMFNIRVYCSSGLQYCDRKNFVKIENEKVEE